MDAREFLRGLQRLGVDFFTGVPDSLLKPLNDTLWATYGLMGAHVVAANEGGAVGLAAGHYIATGHPAMVYLQNSGIGNIINPVASLLHKKVYGIPCVFVVGWRGEPGIKDEPQHAFQGTVTREMLELLDLPLFELSPLTDAVAYEAMLTQIRPLLAAGQSIAFVVHKDGLTDGTPMEVAQAHTMTRENALRVILSMAEHDDIMISTTGKTSREVFELRETLAQGHDHDFLTVGSMGHAGMIALGIAMASPERTCWCLDGDGAALMHLGALAVEAQQRCPNLIHVLLNNGAHESVGGMPVAGGELRFAKVAVALGFEETYTVETEAELIEALHAVIHASKNGKRCFVEGLLCQGSRADLGRPTQTPNENLHGLMYTLQSEGQP